MRHIEEALTFDDVMLAPGYSETLPRDADLSTVLAPGVPLGIPIVSAAMDMVTEARLAIALAEEGGIGIVHRNMPPDVQADKVRRVKKFESGVVRDPITVAPDTTIGQVVELTRRRRISGVPVVDGKRLAGIVTARDLRFETRWNHPRPTGHDPGREAGHRPGGREPRRDHRAPARAPYREAARGQRERGAPRPHHGEGHSARRGLSERLQGRPGPAAGGRRGGHRSGYRRTGRRAGRGRGGRPGGGYRPRAFAGGHRPRAAHPGRLPGPAARGGQHRDRRGGGGSRRSGGERGQGRHRPGLDLHHAGRGGGRGAAAHRDRPRGRRARGHGRSPHRGRRRALFGRHRQGDRGRRPLGDDRQPLRGH